MNQYDVATKKIMTRLFVAIAVVIDLRSSHIITTYCRVVYAELNAFIQFNSIKKN
jgi:hypothetical protein